MKITLASSSITRKNILLDNGFLIDKIEKPDSNEDIRHENLTIAICDIARRKLESIKKEDNLIIAADTLVCLNDRVFGKPRDFQEGFSMLKALSNNTHKVISAISLYIPSSKYNVSFNLYLSDFAFVTFNKLSDNQIKDYLSSFEYKRAAGSYMIQAMPSSFDLKIDGDISTIMGLPMNKLKEILKHYIKL